MPHDMNGIELRVGDVVTIQAVIREIHATERFCNLSLETSLSDAPVGHKTSVTLNARQVEKIGNRSANAP
jgi:hypothetical protein